MDMNFWTEERTALLIELHAKGMSGGAISAEIPGSTRNSVIGKISRMKPPKPAVKMQVARNRKAPAAFTAAVPARAAIDHAKAIVIPLTLMQLEQHSCRWPLWDDSTPHTARFFCSAYAPGVEVARPYCLGHTKKAASHAPLYLRLRPYIPART